LNHEALFPGDWFCHSCLLILANVVSVNFSQQRSLASLRSLWSSVPKGPNVYRTEGPELEAPEERNIWPCGNTLRPSGAKEFFPPT
jgi:hypothetical protein